jgi:hypothetical protein
MQKGLSLEALKYAQNPSNEKYNTEHLQEKKHRSPFKNMWLETPIS